VFLEGVFTFMKYVKFIFDIFGFRVELSITQCFSFFIALHFLNCIIIRTCIFEFYFQCLKPDMNYFYLCHFIFKNIKSTVTFQW
jgi:hypothetical protein